MSAPNHISIPSRCRAEIRGLLRDLEKAAAAIGAIRKRLDDLPASVVEIGPFEVRLRDLQPEFDEKLRAAARDLTAVERKLCVLMRLQVTTSEISRLFALSPRVVARHRGTIRRKLGLEPGEKVAAFLARL